MNEVIVLFEGYSTQIDSFVMDANCSCVLIKGAKNVIIDTMTAWDKNELLEALDKNNIKPSDINYVVCSHSHTDHIGNNNLFTDAEHIVGNTVQKRTLFYDKGIKNRDYEISEGIKIMATPGHTEEDVSVLVNGKFNGKEIKIAITGDLFEKLEDVFDASIWMDLGTLNLRKTQALSRSKIVNLVDIIIPGHGPPFEVTEEVKKKVEDQLSSIKNN